ncbi:MAG: ABC transporter ATP-binding protein [Gammaproteobacteria bacterium]|nr:ABC transporter ATP-binding protein [Gammaproteobacteria bacterium]MCY4219308.1 ABC transporter ATP-binding protein [Gammaproteobacteria bacterium]
MTRSYPGLLANDQVNLTLNKGEIHALLGENGAGKSTLVKMIYGVLKPDSGQILWQRKEKLIASPAVARELGIAMVFQHFSLFDSLTVYENIVLGLEAHQVGDNLDERIVEISQKYGLPLEPDRHVYSLSVGERQRIEIIRCLLQNPKLLIMDEPTSVLTPQEVEALFETLRRLCHEGMSILYISHKLDEIKALCEHATILRHGKVVASVQVQDETANSLAAKMIGEEFSAVSMTAAHPTGELRFVVDQLDYLATDELSVSLKQVCLEVRGGEILGIAGVAGNGQDELLGVLNGEIRTTPTSAIQINGKGCADLGPDQRRSLGLASIPSERLGHGAVPGLTLNENTLLTAHERIGLVRMGLINYQKSEEFGLQVIRDFDVRCHGIQAEAGSLSGGNLQKFIVGREINQQPSVLIVSQPTWGVDAGAAQAIRMALRKLADSGAAILVISQDLDELIQISDRLAAICSGVLSKAQTTAEVTMEQIGLMMSGVETVEDETKK